MVCFVNVLSAAVFICSFLSDVMGNNAVVQNNDNSEQFALLCRMYNVAKNPPINLVDLQEPLNIVKEIDVINDSLTEEKQFNETNQVENSSDAQVKSTTREAAVAQAILHHITRKAHNILEEIKKLNATRNIEKVKDEFDHVIFGEGGNESHLCNGALSGVNKRDDSCGKSGLFGKGTSAGNNLVVDFFCLCAMRTKDGEGIGNVCGVEIGGKGERREKPDSHGWGEEAPLGSSSMWASVKKGCGRLLHQHPTSTKEGHDSIKDFLKHLKTGGVIRSDPKEESDLKKGMLGTSVLNKGSAGDSGPVCNGKKGSGRNGIPGGVCVYYGPEPQWEENIGWLKKLKTALNTVDALNNQTATIQRDIDKLQKLLRRAEEIYETTKVITEIQNPVKPTNLQTATKRLTAYNAARRHHHHAHFILLFVLL
ncbi:Variant surface glycoprotein [Trypanosoma congolense IL3000]|uniref:Variant surface glycoprotein n=1 Tax=Trypanosoma congolense (strain IL3000) TaxID=1068625 RepID=F9WH00_TRYCI|nr:Variant surface glycoprotein [Trypanosoma congolense IL3000]